jgi:hypothetical protein
MKLLGSQLGDDTSQPTLASKQASVEYRRISVLIVVRETGPPSAF